MNFQDLKNIETSDQYLDNAFRKAKEAGAKVKSKKHNDKLKEAKEAELAKITTVEQVMASQLNKILMSFPLVDDLPPFYLELVKCMTDYPALKQSLGSLVWAKGRINSLYTFYKPRIMRTEDLKYLVKMRTQFYGRVSSIMKQISKNLHYLEEARQVMKRFPAVKGKMFSVCIFGFPNVGKSTLLSKLTPSSPEINDYPFTTNWQRI